MAHVHAIIRKAEAAALQMPWRIVPLGSMYAAEKWHQSDWCFVCQFETEDDAVDFLAGKLTQEGPSEPGRG